MLDYQVARARMVREQLVKRGIRDKRVLTVMNTIPRHLFIDQAFWPRAYGDYPLPISCNQTISQPYIVGLMTEALKLSGGENILEIGTGSGYQAAILASLGCTVYTVERHDELSKKAENLLASLGFKSISFKGGDGSPGWPERAPFDGIIVTAGAPELPDILIDQLAVNGRIVIPVGTTETQRMTVIRKGENIIEKHDLGVCSFVPLIGRNGWGKEE